MTDNREGSNFQSMRNASQMMSQGLQYPGQSSSSSMGNHSGFGQQPQQPQDPQQMFDMFNNMMKMMMMNQRQTSGESQGMPQQRSQATMPMMDYNSMMFAGGQVSDQQSSFTGGAASGSPRPKENTASYRKLEDRFNNQRDDLEHFYERVNGNGNPLRSTTNNPNNSNMHNSQLFRGINSTNNLATNSNNINNNVFDTTGQLLPSHSDFVEYDIHDQSTTSFPGRNNNANTFNPFPPATRINNKANTSNIMSNTGRQNATDSVDYFTKDQNNLFEAPKQQQSNLNNRNNYEDNQRQGYENRGYQKEVHSDHPIDYMPRGNQPLNNNTNTQRQQPNSYQPKRRSHELEDDDEDISYGQQQQQYKSFKTQEDRGYDKSAQVPKNQVLSRRQNNDMPSEQPARRMDEKKQPSYYNEDEEDYDIDRGIGGKSDGDRVLPVVAAKKPAAAPSISQQVNPFEEMPIKSNGAVKRFEDLIEEQIQKEEDEDYQYEDASEYQNGQRQSRKKTFLKKGSRAYLSNAQQRSKAALSHIETIETQQAGSALGETNLSSAISGGGGGGGGFPGASKPKQPKKSASTVMKSVNSLSGINASASGPLSSGGANTNNIRQQGPSSMTALHGNESSDRFGMGQDSSQNSGSTNAQQKPKKKFLQRGQGKGGGIQGFKKEDEVGREDNNSTTPTAAQDKKPVKKKVETMDLLSIDGDDDAVDADQYFGGKAKKYEPEKYTQEETKGFGGKVAKQLQSQLQSKGTVNNNVYDFDDAEEWGDSVSQPKGSGTTTAASAKSASNSYARQNQDKKKTAENSKNVVKRQIQDSDAEEENSDNDDKNEGAMFQHDDDEDQDDPESQYSKVVMKYFNKKPKDASTKGQPQLQPQNSNSNTNNGQSIQQFTNEQIEKLNAEISKFKLENERVKKMRNKYEDLLKALTKEQEQFAKQKEMEIAELEEWKKEEQKKIRNEKRISERQSKAMQNMPNRKEREEIEGYKTQIKKMQEEMKMKDQRNKLALEQKKKQYDEVCAKNAELLEDIKHLEKARVDNKGSNVVSQNKGTPANKQSLLQNQSSTRNSFVNTSTSSRTAATTKQNNFYDNDEEGEDDAVNKFGQKNHNGKAASSSSNATSLVRKTSMNRSALSAAAVAANRSDEDDGDYGHYDHGDDDEEEDYRNHDNDDDPEEEFETYEQFKVNKANKQQSQQQPQLKMVNNSSSNNNKKNTNANSKKSTSYFHNRDYDEEDTDQRDNEDEDDEEYTHNNKYHQNKNDESEDRLETYEDIINFTPNTQQGHHNNNSSAASAAPWSRNNSNQSQLKSTNKQSFTTNKPSGISNDGATTAGSQFNKLTNLSTVSQSSSAQKKSKQNQGTSNSQQEQHLATLAEMQKQLKSKSVVPSNSSRSSLKEFPYDMAKLSQHPQLRISMVNKEIDIAQFNHDQNVFYKATMLKKKVMPKIVEQEKAADGKVQTKYDDGKMEMTFPNGMKRTVYPSQYTIVNFANHDIKQVLPDKTIIYYFSDSDTTQTTLPNDDINVYKFPNDQIEIHFATGRKEILFPDGTEKYFHENGVEETFFADGSMQKVDINRVKTIIHVDGQEEIIQP